MPESIGKDEVGQAGTVALVVLTNQKFIYKHFSLTFHQNKIVIVATTT